MSTTTTTWGDNVRYNCKPHAVCIPGPTQSHIKALLKFSKLLHHKDFYITFVNTEFNQNRFLKANSSFLSPSTKLPDFRFETIPDGIQDSDPDSTQDVPSLADSIRKNFLNPFLELLTNLNDKARDNSSNSTDSVPRVSLVVADGFLTFAFEAAERFGIPIVQFFSVSACALMGFNQCRVLLQKGLVPLKGESSLTNEFLDTTVDWVPGMKGIRLRDLPSTCWITDPKDVMFNFVMEAAEKTSEASAVIIHTFDALETDVLGAFSSTIPNLYAIGPLQLLLNHLPESPLKPLPYSLLKEETECLKWLNSQKPNSVMYVNFGSIAVLTPQQVVEFGWGLANRSLDASQDMS